MVSTTFLVSINVKAITDVLTSALGLLLLL